MTITKSGFYHGWKPSPRYQKLFDTYNKKYFDGLLPATKVGTAPLLKITYLSQKSLSKSEKIDGGEYGLAGIDENDSTPFIVLDKGICVFHSILAKTTLFHEMVHHFIGLEKGHGKIFKSQIRRLANLGAFDNLI
jgi:hypothetical protein